MVNQITGIGRLPVAPVSASQPSAPGGNADAGFGRVLQKALGEVARSQQAAETAAIRLVAGESTDLAEVMVASEKATLTLQLAIQVRNKMIEAYQEVMRMPI